jgi:hypothetical protein
MDKISHGLRLQQKRLTALLNVLAVDKLRPATFAAHSTLFDMQRFHAVILNRP